MADEYYIKQKIRYYENEYAYEKRQIYRVEEKYDTLRRLLRKFEDLESKYDWVHNGRSVGARTARKYGDAFYASVSAKQYARGLDELVNGEKHSQCESSLRNAIVKIQSTINHTRLEVDQHMVKLQQAETRRRYWMRELEKLEASAAGG